MQPTEKQNTDWRFINRIHLISDEVFHLDRIHIDLSTLNPDINTNDKLRKSLFKDWMQLLPSLTNLRKLYLSHKVNQAFFEKICEVNQLESLELKWTGIEELSSIQKLKRLSNLHIRSGARISDISPLKDLAGLKSLFLEYLPKLIDFSPIGHLRKLESLSIYGNIYHFKDQIIQTISFLEKVTRLEHLGLVCTKVLDNSYETILQLKNLKHFSISNKLPHDLRERIKKLPNLNSGSFVEYDWDNNRWHNEGTTNNNTS